MLVAADAPVKLNMAYTDWFKLALDDGPFTYVRAWDVEDMATAWYPAMAVSIM